MNNRLLCATALTAALAAPAFAQEGPLKIGASLPLTGNFSVAGQKHQ